MQLFCPHPASRPHITLDSISDKAQNFLHAPLCRRGACLFPFKNSAPGPFQRLPASLLNQGCLFP